MVNPNRRGKLMLVRTKKHQCADSSPQNGKHQYIGHGWPSFHIRSAPAPKSALGCKHFVFFNERTLGVRPVADNWAYACWGIEANTLVGIAGTSLVLAGQHARVCPSYVE